MRSLSACTLLLGITLGAQAPAPGQPTFTGGTTQIEVAAVVTSGGRTVMDLHRDEVQIHDNGVPQPLVAFEYVDLTTASGPPQRRDFVLVLDDVQIDPRTTKPAQNVAFALLDLLAYVQPDILPADRAKPRTTTVRVSRDDVLVRARSAYIPR